LKTGKLNFPQQLRDEILRELLYHQLIPDCKKKKVKWHWNAKIAKDSGIKLSKHGAYAIALGHDRNYIIGDTPFIKGVYEWKFKIGNAKWNIPMISMGVLDLNKEEDLFIDEELVMSNTWGINSDGEIFVNLDNDIDSKFTRLDSEKKWLMESGDEVLLKFDVEANILTILYKTVQERIQIDHIKGKIYPYVHLNNPFDFVFTSIL